MMIDVTRLMIGMLAALLGGCAAVAPSTPPAQKTTAAPPAEGAAPVAVNPAESLSRSDALTDVPTSIDPWTFGDTIGQLIHTPHYQIHTTVLRRAILDRVPLFMERALLHYTSALAELPMPEQPLETYLMGSRGEWETRTRQLLGDQAEMYLNLGRGGFTTRGIAILYDIGRRDTLAIAAHEGWHQYTQQVFLHPLPVWLEEGVATYMEGHISFELVNGDARPLDQACFRPWANIERYEALRQAVRRDSLIPVTELMKRTPQTFLSTSRDDLLTYYGQVWALTHFLAEGEGGRYAAALEELLEDAAAGRLAGKVAEMRGGGRHGRGAAWLTSPASGGPVTQAYFNSDLAAFEAEYEKFVRQIVDAPDGRKRIMRGLSPLAPPQ